tara:strand:- start:611 stop:862 length:252 start_codon:yes stop_codon:yes gene_type:complete
MERPPIDTTEGLSICYKVLAEDLEMLINFMDITDLHKDAEGIYQSLAIAAEISRQKSKKLSLRVVEKDSNVIKVDFKQRGKNV